MSNQPLHLTTKNEITEFLLYTTPHGGVKVKVLLNNETLWLTQKRIAELFGVGIPAISKQYRKQGIASQLLQYVSHMFKAQVIYAKTDIEGLSFYQHCKFQCSPFISQYGRRYACCFYQNMNCDIKIDKSFAQKLIMEQFNTWQLDNETWIRALGWALWKTLCWPVNKKIAKRILHEIYSDYIMVC